MNQSTDAVTRDLPEALCAPVQRHWDDYCAAAAEAGIEPPHNADFLRYLGRVWAVSDFVALACVRNPGLIGELLASGDLLGDYARGEMRTKAQAAVAAVTDADALGTALRRLRRRELVRIAWRDLAGWAPVDEVLEDLSALADACVQVALERLHAWQCRVYGTPRTATGRPQGLVVLGMGKLGARELNFSSDIDLIFAYPEAGPGPGRRRGRPQLGDEEFFNLLARDLIQVLDDLTPEGFVYRVDMRLRPFGDSGPLAMSFAALEDYYQSQGREWERYAMVKARPVAGDAQDAAELADLLRPFVYRRYLDFGAFEQLREMKALIRGEVERYGLHDDIKLGPGGIREVEFIVQAFQLVRGGREPILRERGLLPALGHLAGRDLLPGFAVERLAAAYRFLRRVENRLQAYADEQTHRLPEHETGRLRLAFSLGFPDWKAFLRALDGHRRFVDGQFQQVFAAPQAVTQVAAAPNADLEALWAGHLDEAAAQRLLTGRGCEDCDEALRLLTAFQDSAALRGMGSRGRARLDRLMPLLLAAVMETAEPTPTFARVMQVIESIAGRSAYLALLVEHPMALSQLVRLCAASPWIAAQLARHPLLLDELLDPRQLYAPLRRTDLEAQLAARLADVDALDLERQMDTLRQFQQAAVMRVAAADIVGATPLMVVSDYLTDIAEVILERVLTLCWRQLAARHGEPGQRRGGAHQPTGFAIVAYGKLGGIELSYGSDLDLVFIHASHGSGQVTDGPKVVDNSVFFVRLGQRIIHFLNTLTPAGVLYEVDMRLRPSGASGLLVTSLEAFRDYQEKDAWTWEHQALVRARVVAGDAGLAAAFAAVRRAVLRRPREPDTLRAEVCDMRERMRQELVRHDPAHFDLKQGVGGIADIEFMVQYHVLRYAHAHPKLLVWSDNIRLLETLGAEGLLAPEATVLLADAYRAFRKRVHELTLQELPPVVDAGEFAALRARVAALWREIMG